MMCRTVSASSARIASSSSFVRTGRVVPWSARSRARAARRALDRIAPGGGLDHRHGELGLPVKLPDLLECALSSRLGQLSPRDSQQSQPMEQVAAFQVGRFSEVERLALPRCSGLELEPLLVPGQVLLERHGRDVGGNAAQRLADDQLVVDQAHRQGIAEAEDGCHGVIELGQVGKAAAVNCGQGFGQSNGLDDVRRRGVKILLAEQPRDTRDPAADDPVGCRPEMVIPPWRVDPRAITAVATETAMGPGHPGGLHLHLGQVT